MYKLYWSPGSGAMAPQALFEEVGAQYEKIVIDFEKGEHKSADFLAVNPLGQIPALVLPDGTLMTESAAMLIHICDQHPEAGLAPTAGSSERARFLRWLFFLTSNIYPGVLRYYYSGRYSTDPSAAEGIQAAAAKELDEQFKILNDALDPGPYLLGESFSAADILLWMLIGWHPNPERLFEASPRLKQLTEKVGSRPAVARVWREHEEE